MIEEEYLVRKYCEPKAYWHCRNWASRQCRFLS